MQRKNSGDWRKILVLSDLHSVFLDRRCWKIVLQIAEDWRPDLVVINGDLLDCTTISEHVSKINAFNPEILQEFPFSYELDMTYNEILRPLRKAIGRAKLTIRLGNHEWRFIRPNRANAHALAEINEVCAKRGATRLEDLLKLDKVDAELSYKAMDVLCGTFTFIHGVKTSAGAARANLLRYGSGTSGHSHRGNSFTQRIHGHLQGWWESSCLRRIDNVEYLPHGDMTDWCNGFLTVMMNSKGTFFCDPHFIIGNKCEFEGTIYSA